MAEATVVFNAQLDRGRLSVSTTDKMRGEYVFSAENLSSSKMGKGFINQALYIKA